jgi:hypothetical protein
MTETHLAILLYLLVCKVVMGLNPATDNSEYAGPSVSPLRKPRASMLFDISEGVIGTRVNVSNVDCGYLHEVKYHSTGIAWTSPSKSALAGVSLIALFAPI